MKRARFVVTVMTRRSILGTQQFAASLAHVYEIVEALERDPSIARVEAEQLRADGSPVRFTRRTWTRDLRGALVWRSHA